MHRLKRIKNLTFLQCSVIFFFLAGCAIQDNTKVAEEAVKTFHARFNNENYQEIIANASKEFVAEGGEEKIIAFLQAIKTKLGKHAASTLTDKNVDYGPDGRTIALGYTSYFDHAQVTELFVFAMKRKKALLYRYNIDSKALFAQ